MTASSLLPQGWRLDQPALAPAHASSSTTRAKVLAVLERVVLGASSSREHASMAAQRLLLHLDRTRAPLRHVWGVVDEHDRVIAGALALPAPGRTAQLLASRPRDAAEVVAVSRAIDAAVRGLDSTEAVLAQTLLDLTATTRAPVQAPAPTSVAARTGVEHRGGPGGSDAAANGVGSADASPLDASTALVAKAFRSAAFTPLATLDYLSRRVPRRGEAPAPTLPPSVAISPWRRDDPRLQLELRQLLDRTYESTLDCPGLCGLRDTQDILDGHLAGGRYEPGLWSIVRVDSEAAGALLMSVGHSGDEIELVYLGLAASMRSRGLGRLLLAFGLSQLAGRRERRICLAVDRANAPAVRLYSSAGFVAVGSRMAMIRSLRRG